MQILGDSIRQNSFSLFKILNVILWSWFVLLILGQTKQMSVTIHFVTCSEEKVGIKENFLSFEEMFDSTDQDLYAITKILKIRNIPIENIRGLGYDNGTNVWRGKMALKVGFLKAILIPLLCLVLLICSTQSSIIPQKWIQMRFLSFFYCNWNI